MKKLVEDVILEYFSNATCSVDDQHFVMSYWSYEKPFLFYCTNQLVDLIDVLRHVKFTLTTLQIHVPDLPKNITLSPSLIMKTCNGPRATHVPVGVATIQLIFVVEVDS